MREGRERAGPWCSPCQLADIGMRGPLLTHRQREEAGIRWTLTRRCGALQLPVPPSLPSLSLLHHPLTPPILSLPQTVLRSACAPLSELRERASIRDQSLVRNKLRDVATVDRPLLPPSGCIGFNSDMRCCGEVPDLCHFVSAETKSVTALVCDPHTRCCCCCCSSCCCCCVGMMFDHHLPSSTQWVVEPIGQPVSGLLRLGQVTTKYCKITLTDNLNTKYPDMHDEAEVAREKLSRYRENNNLSSSIDEN